MVYSKEKQKAYNKKHYTYNKTLHLVKNKRNKNLKKIFLWKYFETHPCVDCGFSDPRGLDFDHKNPEEKIKSVAEMARNNQFLDIIKAEILKCEVRCANCHRIRTSQQFGWYKYIRHFGIV